MGNCFFLYLLYVTFFVSLQRFEKAFYQAGEADIHDYAHAHNVFTGIFLHT